MIQGLQRRFSNDAEVQFPTVSVDNFKVLIFWINEMVRTGAAPTADLFTVEVLSLMEFHQQYTKAIEDSLKTRTLTKPDFLIDFKKWTQFAESWETYMKQLRGAAKCPLCYVFRVEESVTEVDRAAIYPNHDAQLIRTTLLSGPHFAIDNVTVYDELKALLQVGPAYPVIMKYNEARDGRKAYLSLRAQFEGDPQNSVRRLNAYAQIANAEYKGETRNYNFTKYVMDHTKALNVLAQLGEPVQEQKKVTDFLHGINTPRLDAAVAVLYASPEKMANFELMHTFLQSFISTVTSAESSPRKVSFVAGNRNDKKGSTTQHHKRDRDDDQKMCSDGKTPLRNLPNKEWRTLSKEKMAMIRRDRASAKNGESRKNDSKRRSVKAAATSSDMSESDDDAVDESKHAGHNFGRKSHGNGKPKAA